MRPLVAGLQGIFVDKGRGCVQRKGPRQIYRQGALPHSPLEARQRDHRLCHAANKLTLLAAQQSTTDLLMHCWWCAGDADAQDGPPKIRFKKPGAEVGNPLEAL